MNTLIIGWGSEIRRDDAAGRLVVRAIQRQRPVGVAVLDVHQLTPETAFHLHTYERVIFVDAAVPVSDGVVRVERVYEPAQSLSGSTGDTHGGSPVSILHWARTLYGIEPEAWLVSVPTEDLSVGTTLSTRTKAGVHEAVRCIMDIVGSTRDRHEIEQLKPA